MGMGGVSTICPLLTTSSRPRCSGGPIKALCAIVRVDRPGGPAWPGCGRTRAGIAHAARVVF